MPTNPTLCREDVKSVKPFIESVLLNEYMPVVEASVFELVSLWFSKGDCFECVSGTINVCLCSHFSVSQRSRAC